MTSPFSKAVGGKANSPLKDLKDKSSPFDSNFVRSPMYAPTVVKEVSKLPLMSLEEIEKTGAKAGKNLQYISSEVLKHQRANNGDEMTDKLNALIKEAKQLDPSSTQNAKGISRFIKKLMGLKEDLFAQFDTVNGRVDVLTKELEGDLKREKDGLYHLEKLKLALKEYAINLHRDIELLSNNYDKQHLEFESVSEEDVDLKAEIQSRMDLLEIKIADLKALRLLCVQMGPRIKGMEDVGKQLIRAGANVIDTVIPAYCANFSLYLHSLRQKKSAIALDSTITEFNNAIQMGSQLASENQVVAAQLSNKQILSIETLKQDQERLLSTLDEVNKINQNARQERIAYITEINALENGMVDKIKEGFFNK